MPLPIELVSFNATVTDDNEVQLEWETASEINNDFFTIERSKDANVWKEVLIIDGAGNSTDPLSYLVTDDYPYDGISYYRLKQTDFDGQFTYSDIQVISLSGVEFEQIKIYPNPGDNLVNIEASIIELNSMRWFNIYGVDVTEQVFILDQKSFGLVVDISKLAKGVYTIKTSQFTQKIIVR